MSEGCAWEHKCKTTPSPLTTHWSFNHSFMCQVLFQDENEWRWWCAYGENSFCWNRWDMVHTHTHMFTFHKLRMRTRWFWFLSCNISIVFPLCMCMFYRYICVLPSPFYVCALVCVPVCVHVVGVCAPQLQSSSSASVSSTEQSPAPVYSVTLGMSIKFNLIT